MGSLCPGALFIQTDFYFPGGPRNRSHEDLLRSRPQEHSRTFASSGAGSHHVVHNEHGLPLNALWPGHGKRATDIGAPLVALVRTG